MKKTLLALACVLAFACTAAAQGGSDSTPFTLQIQNAGTPLSTMQGFARLNFVNSGCAKNGATGAVDCTFAASATVLADTKGGADCGAKINAALAQVGSSGVVQVGSRCGSTISTAVNTFPNGVVLDFIVPGTWTVLNALTVNSLRGLPLSNGYNVSGPMVTLKMGDGRNLAPFITLTGAFASMSDITIDGNKANNPSAGANIKINQTMRATLRHVQSVNSHSHGLWIFSSSGIVNESAASKILNSNFNLNDGNGILCQNTSDIWFSDGSETEDNGAYGIEMDNCPAGRIIGSDIGGNVLSGLYLHGSAGGMLANYQIIVANQFGNQHQHDILVVGYNGGYTSLGNNITGNTFWSGSRRVSNAYDAIALVDTYTNGIAGNVFISENANKYKYGIEGVSLGHSAPDQISSNTYAGVWGTAEASLTANTISCVNSDGYCLGAIIAPRGYTFATLPAAFNGMMVYCADCAIANPCAASGTGAMAKRLNGAWVCN